MIRRLVFVLIIVVLLVSCASHTTAPAFSPTAIPGLTATLKPTPIPSLASTATPISSAYWPTQGWRTSTPEEQGIDSEALVRMLDYIQEVRLNLHSVLIIRNGYLVMEAYWHPFEPDTQHGIHSCTKSFTSALVGIAMNKGYIDSIDHHVLDYFPERTIANNDSRKQTITLKHLLTMSSGLLWPENGVYDSRDPFVQMTRSKDPVQFALDRPMEKDPGALWNYNSGGSHLLSAIVQKATGQSTLSFAQANLFGPLGISDVFWSADSSGITRGAEGLEMMPRDLAKFGYLYLQNGQWDGQQVVPSAWVKSSTTKQIPLAPSVPLTSVTLIGWQDYGYQWWVRTPNGYAAQGYGGQLIYVLPTQDLVVVVTAGIKNAPDSLVESLILPALKSDLLPANPPGVAQLESRLQAIAQPKPKPVAALPATAASVSGKTYRLEPNSLGLGAFSLDFRKDKATLRLSFGENSQQFEIGLDDVYRTTRAVEPLHGMVALKGSWRSEDLLELEQLSNGSVLTFRLQFDEKQSSVLVQSIGLRGEVEQIVGTLER